MAKSYDCIILGAGIAGLGTAAALAEKRKKVLVIGRKRLGAEASPRAAGILDPYLEMPERSPLLNLTLPAFRNFRLWIRRLEKTSGLKVGYHACGMLYAALTREDDKKMTRLEAWQSRKPVPLYRLDGKQLRKQHPYLSEETRGGLFYPSVGRVIAPVLMKAVRIDAEKKGVTLYDTKLMPQLERTAGNEWRVRWGRRKATAPVLVNAAGAWSTNALPGLEKGTVRPVRGQIYILKGSPGMDTILHTLNGYYCVPWGKGNYLLGSTVETVGYRPVCTQSGKHRIISRIRSVFPGLVNMTIIRSWAGLRPCSPDALPLLGAVPGLSGYYMATGYFRSGILIGREAGKLLAQGILTGDLPEVLKPFSPARFYEE